MDVCQQYQQRSYAQIRERMQPGDIIAFGGNSLFSKWAKLTTRSVVTHLAVVIKTKVLDERNGHYFNQAIEATSYNGKCGVMLTRLSERVATYDGDMWWLPLSNNARISLEGNKSAFFDFLLKQNHKPYDIWQLFGSTVDATDNIPLLKKISLNSEDFSSLFCSELVAEAMERGKIIGPVNASEVTPIDICRFNVFDEQYVQFRGKSKTITGYNSLPFNTWQCVSH
ncbi:MAG: hypothetical protein V7733_01355 [Paraglaciecola polaris]|uniref:hypothetical protein n=1 Tax=Paraglaciecola polaris TaxID=222814 RepID=UPI0030038BDE